MSKDIILKVSNVAKQYRLGVLGTGTISHDLNRFFAKIMGKDDPYLKVGAVNDRSKKTKDKYVWALNNIDFEVKPGEVVGIIGKNGAGKSTLLKILSKVTTPTKGLIQSRGKIASLLEVGTGFHPEMTGKENIFLNGAILGMSKKEIASKLEEIVEFSGCAQYIDTPVKRYSSGMKVRLAFAVAAFLEPDILVVDEVLAVGDAEFQKKAIGKMKDISSQGGRTVLFVSHDMGAINSLCSRLIVLEKGEIGFDGDTAKGINYYLSSGITTKNLKIHENYIKAINVENHDSFVSESDLNIILDLKINSPIENPIFLIKINNVHGEKLCEFHSQGVSFNEKIENDCKIKLTVEGLNLHIGTYSIDLIYFYGSRIEFHGVAEFNCVKLNHEINQYYQKGNDFFYKYNYQLNQSE